MLSLSNILEDIKNGNKKSFDILYKETKKSVFYIIISIVKDYGLAEDLMQQTYINIIKYLDNFKAGTNAKGWILTIARNLALNEYNRRKREVFVDFNENESLYGEYSMKDNTENSTIALAVKILSQDEMQILSLILFAGYKRREIAEFLDLPISTVTWKYNEALKKLKKELKKEESRDD